MFCESIRDIGILVPEELDASRNTLGGFGLEKLLDACTRSTYGQPMFQIVLNVAEGVGQCFVDKMREVTETWEKDE